MSPAQEGLRVYSDNGHSLSNSAGSKIQISHSKDNRRGETLHLGI